MDHDITQLWKVLLWGLGICVSGFLFLAGWMWNIVGKVSDKVSHKWLEEKFEKSINNKMDSMNQTMTAIKDALCGDFKSRGLIKSVEDNTKELKEIKENCQKVQEAKL